MPTAFMVTSGCYSDYYVYAVFTEREAAENYAARFPKGTDSLRIEDIPFNEIPDWPAGLLRYLVIFDRDGNCEVYQTSPNTGFEECRPYGDNIRMTTYCWARDPNHASEIANERRTNIMANGEWETDFKVWQKQKLFD